MVDMSHENEKPQRCGWIAIGLVLLLLQGMLPGSIPGGVAGLKSAGMMFGQHAGSDLMIRLFVLGGMITGLMVSAIAVMTLTLALSRTAAFFLKRPAPASLSEKFDYRPEAGRE
jgi:Na+/phosphate symporter